MIHLNGKFYVELKDKRYIIHPVCDFILRKREEKLLKTQYKFY